MIRVQPPPFSEALPVFPDRYRAQHQPCVPPGERLGNDDPIIRPPIGVCPDPPGQQAEGIHSAQVYVPRGTITLIQFKPSAIVL
jgi:hypothetical protein